MHIRCWGSRGSIPVCGREYMKYGGDTTCISITAKSGDIVIIDAGTGIRRLGIHPDYNDINVYNLVFTHFHWDHVMGFNFFRPILEKNKTIKIRNSCFSSFFVKDILEDLMRKPFFPVTMGDLNAKIKFIENKGNKFSIGSLDIETIPLSHPGEGSGYKFTEKGKSFVFLTDNELGFNHLKQTESDKKMQDDSVQIETDQKNTVLKKTGFNEYLKFSKNADLLFHDGEFTPDEYPSRSGWGHSVYTKALDLSIKANVKKLGIFHINQERKDREMDEIIDRCMDIIKQRNAPLDCFGVKCNMEFDL